jgi:hypothetical protein
MTNILAIAADGSLTEVASTTATKAVTVASDGTLLEITASGTQIVAVVASDGTNQEASVTFGGSTSTLVIPTPYWTF